MIQPKIRSDLVYAPDPEREGYWYVKDPIRGEYLSFNEVQVEMMKALDGIRTPEAIQEVLGEEFGVDIPTDKIESFTKRLEREYLLDLSSYKVDDDRTRKAIFKILKKRKLVLRGKPRDESQPEAQLFTQGMEHLHRGKPSEGAAYFVAVLEVNPNNERAKRILAAIHEGFLETKKYVATYKILIPLWKPDRFLRRLDRVIGRFLFSWLGFVTVLLIAVSGLVPIIDVLSRGTVFVRPTNELDIVVVLAVTFLFLMFHESMHGLACTHYGGTVSDIGLMLFYYVLPGAWCDTSDVFVIANRKHKAIVFLAGVGLELVPLSLMWWMLYVADPSVPGWNGLVALGSVIAFSNYQNLNPLVQLDGYFTLAALVGKMNLRSEAFSYIKCALARTLFGVVLDGPTPSPRDRRIYLWYGVLSGVYTPLWTAVELFLFLPWLVDNMGRIGLFLAVFMLYNVVWNKACRGVFRFLRFMFRERRRVFTRRRSVVFGLVLGGIVAIFAAPCSYPVDGEMRVEPTQQASARVAEPGVLDAVLVDEGSHVRAGQVLAVLRSTSLAQQRIAAANELRIAQVQLQRLEAGARSEELDVARARSNASDVASGVGAQRLADQRRYHDLAVASSAQLAAAAGSATHASGERAVVAAETALVRAGSRREEIEAAQATVRHWEIEVAELDARNDRLRIVSPIAGVVVGKRVADRIGERLVAGGELFKVLDDSRWRARIVPLRGESLADLHEGQIVELQVFGNPGDIVEARVDKILAPRAGEEGPTIETTSFTSEGWRAGMTGRARIHGPRRTLAFRFLAMPLLRVIDYDLWRWLWG